MRLSETDRLEAFSDNVRALHHYHGAGSGNRVAGICTGPLLDRLAAQWASYIAFLASFCYAGMIWLNHRAVFARVRYCDRGLHLANFFLILTPALIPFRPRSCRRPSRAALAMCPSWLVVFHVLSIRPCLVEDGVDPDFFLKERFRATLGGVLSAIAGVAGWLSTPKRHCPSF